jgi:hypothetical protein
MILDGMRVARGRNQAALWDEKGIAQELSSWRCK